VTVFDRELRQFNDAESSVKFDAMTELSAGRILTEKVTPM